MKIYTIGYTQKSAERFFGRLKAAGVRTLVDIRISSRSQLAGFAKQPDLSYFLREICGIACIQDALLAPTEQLLKDYRAGLVPWEGYVAVFERLMEARQADAHLLEAYGGEGGPFCFLCSEATPEHCHRRLVAERLARLTGGELIHL